MTDVIGAQADFHRMEDGTREDWAIIAEAHKSLEAALADQTLAHLRLLDGDFGGFAVDRLTHSLQTATLAEADGRDEEYILCALLHDIGDTLAPHNHPDVGAAMVKPFVSEANHWMVQMHGVMQGYYFWHFLGGDRNTRDAYIEHPHYQQTVDFCALYDQRAFDPAGETKPLDYFEPLVRELMAAPRRNH